MINSNLTKIIPELENEIRIRENRNSSKSIILLRSTIRQIKRVVKMDALETQNRYSEQMMIDFPE
jgi:hypothetical protein